MKDIRAFFSFVNFYRRFIDNFSYLAALLIALIKKDIKFSFNDCCKEAFNNIKKAFTTALIL